MISDCVFVFVFVIDFFQLFNFIIARNVYGARATARLSIESLELFIANVINKSTKLNEIEGIFFITVKG